MAENPKAAIDSVLEDTKTVNGLTVYPLTLGRYALLELVESPFVCSATKFQTATLIPTFYIMTHDKSDLRGYTSKNIDELKANAFDWADTQEIADSAVLVNQLIEKFELVNKVKPDATDDGKKKGPPQTDG